MMNMTNTELIVLGALFLAAFIALTIASIRTEQRLRRKEREDELRRLKDRAVAWEAYQNHLAFSEAVSELDKTTIRAFETIIEELAEARKQSRRTEDTE